MKECMENPIDKQVSLNVELTNLAAANKELSLQVAEQARKASHSIIATRRLTNELITTNIELSRQIEKRIQQSAELEKVSKELAFQNEEKAKRVAELVIADEEKAKRAAELVAINKELAFQVKQNKIQHEQILQLSLHDALTKLANRLLLHDRLALTLAANRRSACHGALLFIDLDNFKPANDLFGHHAGDLVLIEVANRLNRSVRLVDTVARVGGDEFVVLITELKQDPAMAKAYALAIAEEIRLSLAKPYVLELKGDHQQTQTVEHHCTASIGVVLFDGNVGSEDEVLDHADKAMYRAKEAGRNRIEFFQEVK
jgi:diguanylate cyclase (GGDEF)-like protein